MSETDLKRLFNHYHDSAPEPPLTPTLIEFSVAGGRRRYRRRMALRTAGGGMAATVVITLASGALSGVTVGEGAGGDSPAGTAARQAETPTAVELLGRISFAAAEKRPVKVADDQFIYSKTKITMQFPAAWKMPTQTVKGTTETWESVDGSQEGWTVGPNAMGEIDGHTTEPNWYPSLTHPTYTFLTTLPTNSDKLLAKVRAHVAKRAKRNPEKYPDPDQIVFEIIGELVDSAVLPPKLGPALYRAAAKIPGVTVVPEIEDAAGRRGIGVTRESTAQPPSDERHYGPSDRKRRPPGPPRRDAVRTWIFDAETYQYLGYRAEDPTTGALRGGAAVLEGAVVDDARQRPE